MKLPGRTIDSLACCSIKHYAPEVRDVSPMSGVQVSTQTIGANVFLPTQRSILEQDLTGKSAAPIRHIIIAESDLIVAAVFTGMVKDNFPMHIETEKDANALEKTTIEKLNTLLGRPDTAAALTIGKTQQHGPGLTIRARSHMSDVWVDSGDVNESLKSITQDFLDKKYYTGKGAYLGLIWDARHKRLASNMNPNVMETNRYFLRSAQNSPGAQGSRRWNPDDSLRKAMSSAPSSFNLDVPWGLIGYPLDANLNPLPSGMGPFPKDHLGSTGTKDKIVGYVHGMCWALERIATESQSNDLVALELALNDTPDAPNTTKIASCLGCTTYMIANDRPPTAMHLGRSESWIPPAYNQDIAQTHNASRMTESRSLTKPTLTSNWETKVQAWFKSGLDLMDAGNVSLKPEINALIGYIKQHPTLFERADELFLDALTIHKKDIDRLAGIFL